MEVKDRIKNEIAACGWTIISVAGTDISPPYAYTIGLTETFLHAELVISGVKPISAQTILNNIAANIKSGERLSDGYMCKKAANVPLRARAASLEKVAKLASMTLLYYPEDSKHRAALSFFQVVIPDKFGKFPWNAEYDHQMEKMQEKLW